MEAGDTCAADLVDNVHHEIDSVVRSHHFIDLCSRRTREGACWPIHTMNLQYVAVINDSQIVDHTPLKFYSQITWYYITQRGSVVCCQVSVILLGEGEKA